jgi:hypothetical protein
MTNAELLAKVERIMETVDDRRFAAELILDAVARGLGQKGGRPRKHDTDVTPEMEVSKPVTEIGKPVIEVSKPVMKPAKTTEMQLAQNLLFSESEKIQKDKKEEKSQTRAPAKASLHDEILAAFGAAWAKTYGGEYRPTAMDRSQLGRMLNGLSAEDIAALPVAFKGYLADPDQFYAKTRHPLNLFCTQGGLNRFRPDKPIVRGPVYEDLRVIRQRSAAALEARFAAEEAAKNGK